MRQNLLIVWILVSALVTGFFGALAGRMYTRHSEQHYAAEQLEERVRALENFTAQAAAAINQLSQQRK